MHKLMRLNLILKRTHLWLLACAMVLGAQGIAFGATTESAVKAGFVYNFTKFIDFPPSTDASITYNLCVAGESKLSDSLDALEGKLVGNKPLNIQRNVSEANLKDCHMVFVVAASDAHIQSLLQQVGTLPIVTVSDSPDFILKGGMIGLIRDGNRVGFEVNLKTAGAAGLRMSAQLLKLAKSVKGLK